MPQLKKIYLEPTWKLPISANYIASSTPDGYEFVRADNTRNRFFLSASRYNISYNVLDAMDKAIPMVLASSRLQQWRKPPADTVLTYTFPGHLVFRREPWVVSMEYPGMLLGGDIKHLNRYCHVLERSFASTCCKKILCEYETAQRALITTIDCKPFSDKITVVLPAPPPLPQFTRTDKNDAVRLFTLGSGNIRGEYESRGIREVLEMFIILHRRYPDLELVVRSDMPSHDFQYYQNIPGLRIIDRVIPRADLEQEFKVADIFVLPSHGTYPFTLMEAMSYELPVVTLQTWANSEFIEDGRTGLLIQPSKKVPYYYKDTAHPNFGSADFRKAIQFPDREVIGELVQKVSLLIDDVELRRKLGKAARQEVESDKLSREVRNKKLKQIFDEATGGDSNS
jgi:hypothetical protein